MAKAATQAKGKPAYACSECGWTSARWVGRCGECQAWGTVAEAGAPKAARIAAVPCRPARRCRSRKVVAIEAESRPTGIGRARPRARRRPRPGRRDPARRRARGRQVHPAAGGRGPDRHAAASATLYVTGEESAAQVRLRADRTGALPTSCTSPPRPTSAPCSATIERCEPTLLVVDSVQTIGAAEVDGVARRRHAGPRGRPAR